MKKNSVFATVILSSILLCSCNNSSKQISVFIYTKDDTFIQGWSEYLDEAFRNSNINLKKYYANRNQSLQNEQITTEIEAKKNDLIIVNSVDRLADSAIIEKAKRYNTPIIFFNREPLDTDLPTDGHYYYVGSNPKTEAFLQAQMIEELFGNPNDLNSLYDKNGDGIIQFVMLKGEQGHQDMENRSKYSIEALKNKGYKLDLLTSSYCDWKRDMANETFATIYQEFGEQIELIISNNDDMALGAIDYLLENNIFSREVTSVSEQPIQIVGVDGTSVSKKAIKEHLMYGTVKNDSKKQVEVIFDLSNKIINNETINENSFVVGHKIYVEGKELTLKNIDE